MSKVSHQVCMRAPPEEPGADPVVGRCQERESRQEPHFPSSIPERMEEPFHLPLT